jgi:hypothetical protein
MAFKVKDLMVNVLGSEDQFLDCTGSSARTAMPIMGCAFSVCPTASIHFFAGACTGASIVCTGGSAQPTVGQPGIAGSVSLGSLAALKEQLKQQLAEVEKQHAAAEDSLVPKTVEDIDMLTNKFNDALEELKARRAELSKKSKPAKNK